MQYTMCLVNSHLCRMRKYCVNSDIYIKCKNIFIKMLKDVGIEDSSAKKYRNKVKVQHACRQREGMIACNNHNMHNPHL